MLKFAQKKIALLDTALERLAIDRLPGGIGKRDQAENWLSVIILDDIGPDMRLI